MGKYQSYPEYQDTPDYWHDRIPSSWGLSRIKFVSRLNPPKSEVRALPSDTEVSFLPMEAIGDDGSLDISRTKQLAEVLDGYSYTANNDVMIAKITPCFENGKGAIAEHLCSGIGFATTEVIVVRPHKREDSRYLYYLLLSEPFRSIAEGSMYGAGGQKRVADSFVANYRTGWPSFTERMNIAAFLDHETTRIDRLIARQGLLIKLLKEKRQAVISHAVTKGLNPDAPMKDSGVEWLGEVPAHWGVTQLQHVVDPKHKIMYGIVLPGPNVDNGVPIVKGGDVKPGRLNLSSLCRTTYEIEAGYARSRLKQGDLVYSIRGTIGDVEIVPQEIEGANLTQDAARIAPVSGIQNTWLRFTIESDQVFRKLEIGSLGAAVKGINICDLKKALIPLPPSGERSAIAEYLDRMLNKLTALQGKALTQIELLREHRTALISAAVTGKIDVRGWQKPYTELEGVAATVSA